MDSVSNSSAVMVLEHVTYRWPKASQATLDIPELIVKSGEHLFIKGPSGCGKSTLLSLLTGINVATSGQVTVLNQSLNQLSGSERDRFRADHIGYIFQQFNLLPYLSVLDNVMLPCQFSLLRRTNVAGQAKQKAKALLERLHLPQELLNKPVTELSIGQQQRVAAARALIGEPSIIIADEPTSALDFDTRTLFIELLLEEADRVGSTLVFVSHDPTLEPMFKRSVYLPELNKAGGKHESDR